MLAAPSTGPSRPGSRTPSRYAQTVMAHYNDRAFGAAGLDVKSSPPPLETLSRRFRRAIIDDDLSRAQRIYAQAIEAYGPPPDATLDRGEDEMGQEDVFEMGTLRDFQAADRSRPSAKSSSSRRGGRSSWDEFAFGPPIRRLKPPTNESGGGGWIGGAQTLSGFFGLATEGGASGCFHIRNVWDPYAVPGPSNWMAHTQAGRGVGPPSSSLTSSAAGLRRPSGPRETDIAGKTSLALALECGVSEEMCAWLIEQGHERGGFSRDASNATIVQLAALHNRPEVIEACCIDAVADAALSHHAQSMSTETRRMMRRRGLTITTDSNESEQEVREPESDVDVGQREQEIEGSADEGEDGAGASEEGEENEEKEEEEEESTGHQAEDEEEEGTASQRATPVPRPRQESERTAVPLTRHSIDSLRPKIGQATAATLDAYAAERKRKSHIPRGTKRLHASVLGLRSAESRRAAAEEEAALRAAQEGGEGDDDDDLAPSPDAVAHEVRELLDWGDNDGRTALQIAAMKGHEECVKLLLDLGADIDIPDREGNTPLHYAAMWGHMLVMQHLIERGCSFALKNIEGFTAADYAYTHSVQAALFAFGRAHYEGRRAARKRTAMAALAAEPSIAHEPHGTVPISLWGEVGAPALHLDEDGKPAQIPPRGFAHLPAFEDTAIGLGTAGSGSLPKAVSLSVGSSTTPRSLGFAGGSIFRSSPGSRTAPLPSDDPGLMSSSSTTASTSAHALTPSVNVPSSATLVDPQIWSAQQNGLSGGSTLFNPSSSNLFEVNSAAEKVRLRDQAAMSFFRLHKSSANLANGIEGNGGGGGGGAFLAPPGRHSRPMGRAMSSTGEDEEQEEILGSHIPGAFIARHARSLSAGASGRE